MFGQQAPEPAEVLYALMKWRKAAIEQVEKSGDPLSLRKRVSNVKAWAGTCFVICSEYPGLSKDLYCNLLHGSGMLWLHHHIRTFPFTTAYQRPGCKVSQLGQPAMLLLNRLIRPETDTVTFKKSKPDIVLRMPSA